MNFSYYYAIQVSFLLFIFSSDAATSNTFCKPRCCQEVLACTEIKQADLPYVITQPGKYCVNTDLTYIGTGPAITISNVENVKLFFNLSSLTLTNPAATGISIANSSEVVIEGDAINNSSLNPTGYGISIDQSEVVALNNLALINHFDGLHITSSTMVSMTNLSIERGANTGAHVQNSRIITFDTSSFTSNSMGIRFYGDANSTPNKDCKVLNCSFFNSTGRTNLFGEQIDEFTMKSCTFLADVGIPTTSSMVEFGNSAAPNLTATAIIIKDVNFSFQPNAQLPRGIIGFDQSKLFIIDNMIINSRINDRSLFTINSNRGLIKDSEDHNPNGGSRIELSSKIVFDNCIMDIFFFTADHCTTKNCTTFVFLRNSSFNNVIEHNTANTINIDGTSSRNVVDYNYYNVLIPGVGNTITANNFLML